jgi:RecA-family ATPase
MTILFPLYSQGFFPCDFLFYLFGMDVSPDLHTSILAKKPGDGLQEQLRRFTQEHPDTKLIIIDTLQKVLDASDSYSYSRDYQNVGNLKKVAEELGICLLLVHHTRKQQADDRFDMISGTNGVFGAADGGMVLEKERRTGNTAILEITGRDQQSRSAAKADPVWRSL